jgi:hypothetical protein
MTAKDVIDILSALLTPVIAVIAVYIAWQQYRLQHKSFNAQIYERRYVVFKAFMKFFSQIMRDGKATYELLGQFYAEAGEAELIWSLITNVCTQVMAVQAFLWAQSAQKLRVSIPIISSGLWIRSRRRKVSSRLKCAPSCGYNTSLKSGRGEAPRPLALLYGPPQIRN